MFARADHVALSVKDMEKAITFYHDVIGMTKVFDRVFGEEMGQLIGVPGTKVRIVHMKLNDSVVELFDYDSPPGREPVRDHRQSDFGLTHIGFIVEDFILTKRILLGKDTTSRGVFPQTVPTWERIFNPLRLQLNWRVEATNHEESPDILGQIGEFCLPPCFSALVRHCKSCRTPLLIAGYFYRHWAGNDHSRFGVL